MRHLETQGQQVESQLVKAICIGFGMHSVKPGYAVLAQELRRLHVCCDHALFDQTVGVITLDDPDRCNRAILTQFEAGTRNIQFNGTAALPRLCKDVVQVMKIAQNCVYFFRYFVARLAARKSPTWP